MESYHDAALFNEMEEFIYIVDIETHDILFMNKALCLAMGIQSYIGKKCYKVLQGSEFPCNFCKVDAIQESSVLIWEHFNMLMQTHYQLKDRLIIYQGHRAMLAMAYDITEREKERYDLKHSLAAGKFLADCVQKLNISDSLSEAVDYILQRTGEFLQADRAYIFKVFDTYFSNTFEWCREGISAQKENLQDLDINLLARWQRYFNEDKSIIVNDIEDVAQVDKAEYDIMSAQGIKSYVIVPLKAQGRVLGFIGVDNPPAAQVRHISETLFFLAHFISNIFLKEEQYLLSVKHMMTVNPGARCVFRLNLTRDLCTYANVFVSELASLTEVKTAHELFTKLILLVTDEDEKTELEKSFTREALLTAFEEGKSEHCFKYCYQVSAGDLCWVATYIRMIQNIKTNEIEAAVYSMEIDDEMKQGQIVQNLVNNEYDFIALINAGNGLIDVRVWGRDNGLGLNHGVLAGRDFTGISHYAAGHWAVPEDWDRIMQNDTVAKLKTHLAAKREHVLTIRYMRKDGSIICKQNRFSYLDKTCRYIMLLQTDITELYNKQQQAMEALRADADMVHDIMDMVHCGIIVMQMPSPEKIVVEYISQGLYRMLHRENDVLQAGIKSRAKEDSSEELFAYFHLDDRERVKHSFFVGYGEKYFTIDDCRMLCRDGSCIWVSLEVSLRKDLLGYKRFYATFHEVTKELQLRSALQEQLEREKGLKQAAMQANQMKSSFLSNVSHDMRTPLNGIMGYTYLALHAADVSKTMEYLQKIQKSGEVLTQLVNDTLDLNKIATGRVPMSLEAVQNKKLLDRVRTAVSPWLEEKNISFSYDNSRDIEAVIDADMTKIQEIFLNLLGNAVKFTSSGGRIELIEECIGYDENYLHKKYIVRDNGYGMTEDFLTKLFEPFMQERLPGTEEIGGSGLGLAIVKNLVDFLGGHINVRSKLGEGTEFMVFLDFVFSEKSGILTQNTQKKGKPFLYGSKILVCEDNPLNMEIILTILQMQGIEVVQAANGRDGVEAFLASPEGSLDIILMDIRMPEMDGREAARHIRASGRADAQVPIIAMTADVYEEDVDKCRQAGMNGHIAKPIEPEVLFAELAEYIG